MTPAQTLEFFKTGSAPVVGAAIGAGIGAMHQSQLLGTDEVSPRQKRLLLDIAKQKLEVRAEPSSVNVRRLKHLQLQYRVASWMKGHPTTAVAASGLLGATIGGLAGRRIGQL
jgi:hypothetical protein